MTSKLTPNTKKKKKKLKWNVNQTMIVINHMVMTMMNECNDRIIKPIFMYIFQFGANKSIFSLFCTPFIHSITQAVNRSFIILANAD